MITDSFDTTTKPLISLKDFYGEQRFFADVCIVTFSKVIYDKVLATYECEKIAAVSAACGDLPIYMFYHNGKKIAFYLSMIGSTCAAQCVLESNWLIGATKYVMFGSSGSLVQEKTANRFMIPTEAYRDEGMSYHYAPPGDYITVKNSPTVKDIFDQLHVPYIEGKVWTTDAFLRETAGQAVKRREEGCIAVEMEIAGVQAVCDFIRLNLYTFIVTGDVLSENSYSTGSLSDANHNIDNFQLALEIASRV